MRRSIGFSASMSHLTCSIASRWSGVSRYGKAVSNSLSQSESGGNAKPRRRRRSAYRLSSSPASSWAARRARAFIVSQRVPASLESGGWSAPAPAERGMVAAGADVARALRELVDRPEALVSALDLEVEVVAGDAADGLGVQPGE